MTKLKTNKKGHTKGDASDFGEAIRAKMDSLKTDEEREELRRKIANGEPLHELLLPEHFEAEDF